VKACDSSSDVPKFSGKLTVSPNNHHLEGYILHNELSFKISPLLKSIFCLNFL